MTIEDATCRICQCTKSDCSFCVVLTGEPCFWVQSDLCSACAAFAFGDAERARARGRRAMQMARRRSGVAPGFLQLAGHGESMLRVCVRIQTEKRKAIA